MSGTLLHIKQQFREGRHADAIAACETLCLQEPANQDAKRLCATMHAMLRNHARALELLLQLRDPANEDADNLFNIALCERELKQFASAATYLVTFTQKFPGNADGWGSLAQCRLQLGEFDEAVRAADRALALDPAFVEALTARGDANNSLGRIAQAADDYRAALGIAPGNDETLKKATLCLLDLGKGHEALALCRDILKAHPDHLTAKRGAEWVMSKLVPLWHIPMMNEPQRNQAFLGGLQALVTPDKLVFEIGTGSGLLAMMAARAGAKRVVTCEAEALVAHTAKKIIARNGYASQVTVLAKPSHAVQVAADLPEKADILVHEIFSSELLGEHVLAAIEDAKARLLKPGGQVLPGAASIMIALVGGQTLGKYLHVGESFGFDLSEFNAIHPKKRPLFREDLAPLLLSGDVEAFRFDFSRDAQFPAERKQIAVKATSPGLCFGVIQWIRLDMVPGVRFENHPSHNRAVSNWQHTVYGFEQPMQLKAGDTVNIRAMHDRAQPWFEMASRA